MIVPLFPLPGAFLFPGQVLPLHIFEPRYRQMVDDLLDTAGRFALATQDPGDALEGSDASKFFPVGGLGEISGHERLPDGRYLIALHGIARVSMAEVESHRLYRQVEATPLAEQPVAAEEEAPLSYELRQAVQKRSRGPLTLPDDLGVARLTDVLLLQLALSAEELTPLFSEPDLSRRARGALDAHTRHD